jgi:hypothetical protein
MPSASVSRAKTENSKLIQAIPKRMHDEKKPGDVLKVPGDPLDDVADDGALW